MKSRPSKYRAATPLNTQDVTRLAGTSRRMLDHYEAAGLLVPNRAEGAQTGKKQWSVDQAKVSERVRILQHGKSIEEIAELASGGPAPFLREFRTQCAQDVRESWRQLQAALLDAPRCANAQDVGERGGLYLRYLPQLWYVLLPVDDATGLLPNPGQLGRAYVNLHGVAHVLGWSTASSAGALASMDEGAGARSPYAFIELAAPPMPAPDMGPDTDGGCYCSAVEAELAPRCRGEACLLCALYGREPTTEERFNWKTEESTNPGQWGRTLMAAAMPRPYPYGVWSPTSRREDGSWDFSTHRPRLMPHEVRLPLGVTACSMPAGVYLCTQCDEGHEADTCQRLLGTVMAIGHRAFSQDDELACWQRAQRARAAAAQRAQGPQPYGRRLSRGPYADDAEEGWAHGLGPHDLRELTVPTGMALAPESGICLTCATLPTRMRNDVPRMELRVLVDAGGLGPEDGRGRLWEA